jgi:hypothetical protein
MARWTVDDGGHEFIVQALPSRQVSLGTSDGLPFVVAPKLAEEIRIKIGLAIGVARDAEETPR